MSEKTESVLQVQPYAYNPSLDQSAAYLDRAHMRLEFTPTPEKIESIAKPHFSEIIAMHGRR